VGFRKFAEIAGFDIYRNLTKKEVKLFRKFLKKRLCTHGSWAQPWFSEAQRLNRKARYTTISQIERIQFLHSLSKNLQPWQFQLSALLVHFVLDEPSHCGPYPRGSI
jgi:hypothetical protein